MRYAVQRTEGFIRRNCLPLGKRLTQLRVGGTVNEVGEYLVKNIFAAALAVAAIGITAPAIAQDSAAPAAADPAAQSAAAKAGDSVYDQAGEVVGTIEKVEGDNFVISTGANRATLALASLGQGPKGFTIGMTKAELETAIQRAAGGAPAAEAPAGEAPAN